MKADDYKEYVYLRIPKKEYQDIIKNKRLNVTYMEIELWHKFYKFKNRNKTISAELANKEKQKKILEKIFNALENYYNGLFKEENKLLTSYKLAKLANINYLTARKYWEEKSLKENFKKDYLKALKELKEQF